MMSSLAAGPAEGSLYDVLGVDSSATVADVRRQYRKLATKLHPDRQQAGGSHESTDLFMKLQQAYHVLSDPVKRAAYDKTGTWAKGAGEDFLASFSSGTFMDRGKAIPAPEPTPLHQLVLAQPADTQPSHSAGFEAWLRARGEERGVVFNAESAAEQFGVVASSYEAVPLPNLSSLGVQCQAAGQPDKVLSLESQSLPAALEWGQVLVEWRYAPINPADLYSARVGGIYGSETAPTPYCAGHDGVGVVSKVGPGVKGTFPGDVVMPAHSFVGTWRQAAVVREADLLRVPAAIASLLSTTSSASPGNAPAAMNSSRIRTTTDDVGGASIPAQDTTNQPSMAHGLEVLALAREACLAYLLLERFGGLKPGDCVILNAATSSVGQAVIQMARLLRLRVVAVVRQLKTSGKAQHAGDDAGGQTPACQPDDTAAIQWQRVESWLKDLGATVVVPDTGSVRVALEGLKFFSRPKLALDSVGGDSAVRLAEALADGGELVTYGCMTGRAPAWPWQAWVFKELKVTGFNLRRWMSAGAGGSSKATTPGGGSTQAAASAAAKFMPVLEAVTKLVVAGLLVLNYTEYDLSEFSEALEHAQVPGRHTKVVVRMQPLESDAHTGA